MAAGPFAQMLERRRANSGDGADPAWRGFARRSGLIAAAPWIGLGAGVLALALASLLIGAFDVSAGTVAEVLLGKIGIGSSQATEQEEAIVWIIRFPRVVMAAAVGAGLGIAGAALQGLFRNPLADPSLIGVSSGAAFFAAVAVVAGLSAISSVVLPLAAFLGGLTVTLLIYGFSRRGGRAQVATMLLAGIAVNALLGSAISFLVFLADDPALRDIVFWLIGSLSGSVWRLALASGPLILFAVIVLIRYAGALNLLSLGAAEARHVGLRVERAQFIIVSAAAMAAGAGVAVAGVVGFVGLIAPHLVRLVVGPDHRRLLPASALAGAILVMAGDLFARTILEPQELPLGVVTAALGTPVLLILIDRSRRRLEMSGW